MYVSITTPNLDYVQTAWNTLKEGAKIYMELAESFFAKAHGSMCDRFGVNWMFTVTK
jgi:PhnB protein